MENTRYFIKITGDQEGWIYFHESSFAETETTIEVLEEFTHFNGARDVFNKSEVREITKEEYESIEEAMVDGDTDEAVEKVLKRVKSQCNNAEILEERRDGMPDADNTKECIKILNSIRAWEESDMKIYALDESIDALSKQIPAKVEAGTAGGFDFYCTCGNFLSATKEKNIKYCPNCGQKLDWD